MQSLFVSFLKLLLPWIKEWWGSKDFTPRSQRALREIHVMFFMHVILFVFFLLSIEHGIGVYVKHAEHVRVSQNESRIIVEQRERVLELKEQNAYLKRSYLQLLTVLEDYAGRNPQKFNEEFNIAPIAELRRGVTNNDNR